VVVRCYARLFAVSEPEAVATGQALNFRKDHCVDAKQEQGLS
jgi:hypothetical protein